MIVSSNTTEVPDVTDRGCICLRKIGENWGTVVTFGLVIVWGGIYMFIFLGRHVTTERIWIYLAIFLPFLTILILLIWSYLLTLFTSPRQVPSRFKLSDGEWEILEHLVDAPTDQQDFVSRLAAERQIVILTPNGQISVCRPCRQLKPERAHHCRRCKTCVMRMDHHCPWFNNCVHFHNYRSFFCTLFYTTLIFAYVAISVVWYYAAVPQWQLKSLALYEVVLTVVGLSGLCSIVLGSFFFYHVYLSSSNRTHIENLNPETKRLFNLGSSWKNFQAIHGSWFLWWLPLTFPEHDGCVFSRSSRPQPQHVVEVSYSVQNESKLKDGKTETRTQGPTKPMTTQPQTAHPFKRTFSGRYPLTTRTSEKAEKA